MNQIKIGSLLRELRKEKNLSQEQLAERFNVSSRSVSRWENGNTMPDISIIIELADFYDIDIRELLSGERQSEKMDKELRETLVLVSEYTNAEKEEMLKEIVTKVSCLAVIFGILGVIHVFQLARISEMFIPMTSSLLAIGFVYSLGSAIQVLQLKGKASKKAYKRFILTTMICGVIMLILSVAMILWLIGGI